MRSLVSLVVLVGVALVLGCISAEKSMDVEVTKVGEVRETEQVQSGMEVKTTVKVSAENTGDPGQVIILVTVYDEIDDIFAQKRETIHLDSGEVRNLAMVLSKVAPSDADVEAFHVSAIAEKTIPD